MIWRAQELKSTSVVKNQWVTMEFPQQSTDFESVFKKNIFQAVKIRFEKSDYGFGWSCFIVTIIIFQKLSKTIDPLKWKISF